MTRFDLTAVVIALVAASCCVAGTVRGGEPSRDARPNILFILSDDHAAHAVSACGSRQAIYYRFYEQAFGVGPHEGVRTARYKLIHYLYDDNARELYDLKKDPDELHKVFGDPNYADVATQLQTQLTRLRTNLHAEPIAASGR